MNPKFQSMWENLPTWHPSLIPLLQQKRVGDHILGLLYPRNFQKVCNKPDFQLVTTCMQTP